MLSQAAMTLLIGGTLVVLLIFIGLVTLLIMLADKIGGYLDGRDVD